MQSEQFKRKINYYGENRIPFLFLIDFEMQAPFVCKLSEAKKYGYLYDITGSTNKSSEREGENITGSLSSEPVNKERFTEAFKIVMDNLQRGNSYLTNLTFPSKIKTNLSMDDIFYNSRAPYKLYHPDMFVSFSPESFVRIENNTISSYPMKGTVDASVPNSIDWILQDEKETREHNTIVDLIRNDLSMVARDVSVVRYRYIDKIGTNKNQLYQVSSEIQGKLDLNWRKKIGDILFTLLPAGSISGAPKQKTIEIIQKAEQQKRGYYTGIFGKFDGENLESAVNIRYIEKTEQGLQFRSGGGITALSELDQEYEEMIEKVYVPIS